MTLDLSRIVDQISEMVISVDSARDRARFDALRAAWESLDSHDVNRRFTTAKTSFLLARTPGDYRRRHPLPEELATYVVASTDGSMILPDRHSPARFYLLNIGKVVLRYGERSSASMSADPELRFREEDLWFINSAQRIPVNQTIVGLRRAAAELRAAASLLDGETDPALGLLDGTLILWSLTSQERIVTESILPEFLDALRSFKDRGQPVASFISAPGASDLMNTLRVSICDYPAQGRSVNCDHCRARIASEGHQPYCEILPGVPDRYLLEQIACLTPGERTTIFDSVSSILDRYDDDLRIRFFYLHTGREIARIEVPAWVTWEPQLLDQVHRIVYDQCQLGRGYPVALQEAHEQAVLSTTDRRLVEEVIERQLAQMGVVMMRTGKDGSKRGRFV